jgi:hypothetical protein
MSTGAIRLSSRTVYFSPKYNTLVLDEEGQRTLYSLDQPDSVQLLFARRGFPDGHVGSGIRLGEETTGPSLLLHRTYLQRMPGEQQTQKLIWCCQVWPDRDAEAPVVLTEPEAQERFSL